MGNAFCGTVQRRERSLKCTNFTEITWNLTRHKTCWNVKKYSTLLYQTHRWIGKGGSHKWVFQADEYYNTQPTRSLNSWPNQRFAASVRRILSAQFWPSWRNTIEEYLLGGMQRNYSWWCCTLELTCINRWATVTFSCQCPVAYPLSDTLVCRQLTSNH